MSHTQHVTRQLNVPRIQHPRTSRSTLLYAADMRLYAPSPLTRLDELLVLYIHST